MALLFSTGVLPNHQTHPTFSLFSHRFCHPTHDSGYPSSSPCCHNALEGFVLDCIGPHSICAAGATALFLNNVDPLTITIRKLGCWRRKTWLTYIHNQIAELTTGMARRMSRPIVFHNVASRVAC